MNHVSIDKQPQVVSDVLTVKSLKHLGGELEKKVKHNDGDDFVASAPFAINPRDYSEDNIDILVNALAEDTTVYQDVQASLNVEEKTFSAGKDMLLKAYNATDRDREGKTGCRLDFVIKATSDIRTAAAFNEQPISYSLGGYVNTLVLKDGGGYQSFVPEIVLTDIERPQRGIAPTLVALALANNTVVGSAWMSLIKTIPTENIGALGTQLPSLGNQVVDIMDPMPELGINTPEDYIQRMYMGSKFLTVDYRISSGDTDTSKAQKDAALEEINEAMDRLTDNEWTKIDRPYPIECPRNIDGSYIETESNGKATYGREVLNRIIPFGTCEDIVSKKEMSIQEIDLPYMCERNLGQIRTLPNLVNLNAETCIGGISFDKTIEMLASVDFTHAVISGKIARMHISIEWLTAMSSALASSGLIAKTGGLEGKNATNTIRYMAEMRGYAGANLGHVQGFPGQGFSPYAYQTQGYGQQGFPPQVFPTPGTKMT